MFLKYGTLSNCIKKRCLLKMKIPESQARLTKSECPRDGLGPVFFVCFFFLKQVLSVIDNTTLEFKNHWLEEILDTSEN